MMEKNNFSQIIDTFTTKSFGYTPNSEEVFCHTLVNKNGVELSILNYGATITSLKIPLLNGKTIDVVLGFDTIDDYINSFSLPAKPYFGAIIGRYSGRIKNGVFNLNGKNIQLNTNLGNHHLHGGNIGFSQKIWTLINSNKNSLTLQLISKDLDENFPGELTLEVIYTLTDENEIIIEYFAKSTKDTIINLTNHSYFNLDGHSETIKNQQLQIQSTQILNCNEENIPDGIVLNSTNSQFDFSLLKNCPTKIDTSFVLEDNNKVKATLFSKKNNLKMEVYTNQPSIHVYVGGNCFNKIKGKENANYHTESGICFETQNFPDAPNHINFPSAILKKEETYHQKTSYKFEKL